MKKIITSTSAMQRGFGIDHNKRVLRLTKAQQDAIKKGALCFFVAARPAHPARRHEAKAYLRKVRYYPKQYIYGPRVPTEREIKQAEKSGALKGLLRKAEANTPKAQRLGQTVLNKVQKK